MQEINKEQTKEKPMEGNKIKAAAIMSGDKDITEESIVELFEKAREESKRLQTGSAEAKSYRRILPTISETLKYSVELKYVEFEPADYVENIEYYDIEKKAFKAHADYKGNIYVKPEKEILSIIKQQGNILYATNNHYEYFLRGEFCNRFITKSKLKACGKKAKYYNEIPWRECFLEKREDAETTNKPSSPIEGLSISAGDIEPVQMMSQFAKLRVERYLPVISDYVKDVICYNREKDCFDPKGSMVYYQKNVYVRSEEEIRRILKEEGYERVDNYSYVKPGSDIYFYDPMFLNCDKPIDLSFLVWERKWLEIRR